MRVTKSVIGWGLICFVWMAMPMSSEAAEISLNRVPEKIVKAAKKAVRGIKLKKAEVQQSNQGRVYVLTGKEDDDWYRITIKPSGHVILIIELDDDDDDHDDDDHDDDEDGDDEDEEKPKKKKKRDRNDDKDDDDDDDDDDDEED